MSLSGSVTEHRCQEPEGEKWTTRAFSGTVFQHQNTWKRSRRKPMCTSTDHMSWSETAQARLMQCDLWEQEIVPRLPANVEEQASGRRPALISSGKASVTTLFVVSSVLSQCPQSLGHLLLFGAVAASNRPRPMELAASAGLIASPRSVFLSESAPPPFPTLPVGNVGAFSSGKAHQSLSSRLCCLAPL
jgi:hypothetical protein